MIDLIRTMFSYDFMVQAIVVGLLVTLCASLLGVSMVLKRYSMIGDGLSHVGFASLALASALNVAPLKVAVPVCIVAAFFLLRISSGSKIKGDQALAILCSGSLAVGVMILSLSSGMNTDINNYMFGSILSISEGDALLTKIIALIVIVLFIVFYNRIFAVTFDESFAKATGTRAGLYNMVLAILTAVTVVIGMRMMGALLISSLIIFPALTSMQVFKNFKSVIISSGAISIVCFLIGIVFSYFYAFPTGACIVVVNLLVFILFTIILCDQIH